ncbi:MAG: ferrochelatase [Actinomycetia bacterium]|nr:ferrochelatase [Actinomycetes bacterium]
MPFDSVLIVAFGGPEGPDEVIPFLENVTRGRGVPRQRLDEVAEQYHQFGGRSPLNEQVRELTNALTGELATHGPFLPVYWGNRNWDPYLADTMAQLTDDGRRRTLAISTSAYGGYSGCRQYREDIARARTAVGERAPAVEKIRPYYDHPGFIEPMVRSIHRALDSLATDERASVRFVFTAHSIPTTMAESSVYPDQVRRAAELVLADLGVGESPDVAWQSRSGPPQVPWLEPGIDDRLAALADEGVGAVVVVPVGFTSDHMEVIYDLDTQALATADSLGLTMVRTGTAGTDPAFVAGLRGLLIEHIATDQLRHELGLSGPRPRPGECHPGCCRPPPRRQSP